MPVVLFGLYPGPVSGVAIAFVPATLAEYFSVVVRDIYRGQEIGPVQFSLAIIVIFARVSNARTIHIEKRPEYVLLFFAQTVVALVYCSSGDSIYYAVLVAEVVLSDERFENIGLYSHLNVCESCWLVLVTIAKKLLMCIGSAGGSGRWQLCCKA